MIVQDRYNKLDYS